MTGHQIGFIASQQVHDLRHDWLVREVPVERDQLRKRLLEVLKPLPPYRVGPPRFNVQYGCAVPIDRLPTATRQKYKTPRTPFSSPPFDVAEGFQVTEQIVCGLPGHVDAIGQIAGAYTVRVGIHHYIKQGLIEITKAMLP
jgi:hypothetical protein